MQLTEHHPGIVSMNVCMREYICTRMSVGECMIVWVCMHMNVYVLFICSVMSTLYQGADRSVIPAIECILTYIYIHPSTLGFDNIKNNNNNHPHSPTSLYISNFTHYPFCNRTFAEIFHAMFEAHLSVLPGGGSFLHPKFASICAPGE